MAERPNLPGFRDLWPQYVVAQQPATPNQTDTRNPPANHGQGRREYPLPDANLTARGVAAPSVAHQRLANQPAVRITQGFPSGQHAQPSANRQSTTPGMTASTRLQGSSAGRTHTHEDRRHTCDICEKRFSRPGALVTHMNSHTGDKPFVCDFPGCDKEYTTKSNMRRHSHSHTSAGGTSFASSSASPMQTPYAPDGNRRK